MWNCKSKTGKLWKVIEGWIIVFKKIDDFDGFIYKIDQGAKL